MLNTRGVNFERLLAAMAAVNEDALRWYEAIATNERIPGFVRYLSSNMRVSRGKLLIITKGIPGLVVLALGWCTYVSVY